MKKIILVWLVLLLAVSGCGKKTPVVDLNSAEAIAEQEKFEQYLDAEWLEALSQDKLSAHFLVADLSRYGLENMETSMGHIEPYDFEKLKSSIATLEQINRNLLTDQQKNYYDRYLAFQKLNVQYEGLEDYQFMFSANSGINVNLITTLTEFVLREEQDIKDIIVYLQQSGSYLQECLDATQKQVEKGIVQSDSSIQGIIDQCERFLSGTPNEVEKIICTRIEDFSNLSSSAKKEYQKQVKQAVQHFLIPGYENVVTYFTKLKGTATNNGAYANWEEGKKYYEVLLKDKTSSDLTPSQIKKKLSQAIEDGMKTMYTIILKDQSIIDELETPLYEGTDANEILKYLHDKIQENYPTPADVTYHVDYLDPTVVSDNVVAYYLIPPVDQYEKNVIRVNPNVQDLFGTLAHEGYPGHLYQNTYFLSQNFHPIENVMNYIGYTEGWAVYVEMDAYHMGNITNEDVAKLLQINTFLSHYLVSYVDIMVNYDGASLDEVQEYLEPFGIDGSFIYELVLQDPAMYLPYGFGHLQMARLREKAETKLKDKFVAKEFHEVVLNTGICSFEYLEQQVDAYIKSK